jgi:hypothetical protein
MDTLKVISGLTVQPLPMPMEMELHRPPTLIRSGLPSTMPASRIPDRRRNLDFKPAKAHRFAQAICALVFVFNE